MGKRKSARPNPQVPGPFEQARDELFSHILRCGVLDAAPEHRKDWFDDTMEYLSERYQQLSDDELTELRRLGERYCQPVIQRSPPVGAAH
jgi:hypothetical protein